MQRMHGRKEAESTHRASALDVHARRLRLLLGELLRLLCRGLTIPFAGGRTLGGVQAGGLGRAPGHLMIFATVQGHREHEALIREGANGTRRLPQRRHDARDERRAADRVSPPIERGRVRRGDGRATGALCPNCRGLGSHPRTEGS